MNGIKEVLLVQVLDLVADLTIGLLCIAWLVSAAGDKLKARVRVTWR